MNNTTRRPTLRLPAGRAETAMQAPAARTTSTPARQATAAGAAAAAPRKKVAGTYVVGKAVREPATEGALLAPQFGRVRLGAWLARRLEIERELEAIAEAIASNGTGGTP